MDPLEIGGTETHKHWANHFDGFKLEADYIRGLRGEGFIDPYLVISTDSKPISIESIELITPTGRFPAEIPEQSKLIPAFTHSKRLLNSWMLHDSTNASHPVAAAEIMGKSSRILLHLKVGEKETVAEIDYRRVK